MNLKVTESRFDVVGLCIWWVLRETCIVHLHLPFVHWTSRLSGPWFSKQQAPLFNRNVPTNLMQRGNRAAGEFAKMLTYPFNSTRRDLFFTCWYFLISFRERMALNSSLFWLDLRRSCSVIHRWKIPMQFTHTNRIAFATSWEKKMKEKKGDPQHLLWLARTDNLLATVKYVHVTCLCVLRHTFLSEEIICVPV